MLNQQKYLGKNYRVAKSNVTFFIFQNIHEGKKIVDKTMKK